MTKIIEPANGFRQTPELSKRELQVRVEFLQGAINGLVQNQRFAMGIIEKLCALHEVNLDDFMKNVVVIKKQDGTLYLERTDNAKEESCGTILPCKEQTNDRGENGTN